MARTSGTCRVYYKMKELKIKSINYKYWVLRSYRKSIL